MPQISAEIRAALDASLGDTANQWTIESEQEHRHTNTSVSTSEGSEGESETSTTETIVVSRTLRLGSEVLELQFVVMVELENDVLQHLTVHYGGTGHESDDVSLLSIFDALPRTGIENKTAEFVSRLGGETS